MQKLKKKIVNFFKSIKLLQIIIFVVFIFTNLNYNFKIINSQNLKLL